MYFIRYLISKYHKININDLVNILITEYGISKENYKCKEDIISSIKNTEMYYNPIMECVYESYDLFYDEV